MNSLRICIFILFVVASSALNAADQRALRLTDGRMLDDWQIVGQADDSVTIRYRDGITKVNRALLPPEIRAQYPSEADKPLPPEPFGIEKPNKGERSISREDHELNR